MCPTECPWVFIGKYIPLRKYTYLLQTNIVSIRFIPLPKFHFVINSLYENYLMKQYHLSSGIFVYVRVYHIMVTTTCYHHTNYPILSTKSYFVFYQGWKKPWKKLVLISPKIIHYSVLVLRARNSSSLKLNVFFYYYYFIFFIDLKDFLFWVKPEIYWFQRIYN